MSNPVITIKIEAPELSEAINRLSAALQEGKALAVPQTPGPAPAIPAAPQPPVAAPAVPVTPAAPVTQAAPVTPPAAPMVGQTASAYPTNPAPQTAAPAPGMPMVGAPAAPVAPVAPTTPAPGYTVEQLSKAGAALTSIDPGKRGQLIALLQQFGVQAITQLAPEHYGAFATALRGLGAAI